MAESPQKEQGKEEKKEESSSSNLQKQDVGENIRNAFTKQADKTKAFFAKKRESNSEKKRGSRLKGAKKAFEDLSKEFGKKDRGHKTEQAARAAGEDESMIQSVPLDSVLEQMQVFANKHVTGVSVKDFYDTVFSEGNETDKEPLFGPWLEKCGKKDVKVGAWEYQGDFAASWSVEDFTQKRKITFVFDKDIPFAGPTVASVTHTHLCRLSQDKCVLQMTVEMEGIPYSNCFKVEVRWVVTALGKNDVVVQIGLYVNFIKSCIVSSKIRSSTTTETTKSQLDLLETAIAACGATAEEVEGEPEEIPVANTGVWAWLAHFFVTLWSLIMFWQSKPLEDRKDNLAIEAKLADKKMKQVIELLDEKGAPSSTDDNSEVLDELKAVNASLGNILSKL